MGAQSSVKEGEALLTHKQQPFPEKATPKGSQVADVRRQSLEDWTATPAPLVEASSWEGAWGNETKQQESTWPELSLKFKRESSEGRGKARPESSLLVAVPEEFRGLDKGAFEGFQSAPARLGAELRWRGWGGGGAGIAVPG